MNTYFQIPLASEKRHLIVGDIHGRFDTFWDLLQSANYDPEKDIIYSVGDLIDRGPQSYEVLAFFQQKNTYAIRGNHEQMAYHPAWLNTWLHNGGVNCLQSLRDNNYDASWLKEYIQKLPFVIDVGSEGEEHAFRIVHAEIPLAWSEDEFQNWMRKQHDRYDDYEHIMWSRSAITQARRNIGNLKPLLTEMEVSEDRSGRNIFCGHTPIPKVMTVGDMTYLDTYASFTMSMIDAVTKQVYTLPVKR